VSQRLPRGPVSWLLVAVVAVAAVVAGCMTTSLRTAPAPVSACDAALLGGTLVSDPANGLALTGGDGGTILVLWPYGYSARGIPGNIELVDETGRTVAREGALIEMGGGSGANGVFVACAGTIRPVPPPG
jgi:hypothetical protein